MVHWCNDLFSVFLLVLMIRLSGYMPFETGQNSVDIDKILKADYSFDPQYWNDISDSGN